MTIGMVTGIVELPIWALDLGIFRCTHRCHVCFIRRFSNTTGFLLMSSSSRQRKGKVVSSTKLPKQVSSLQGMPRADIPRETRGTTSSMNNVRVQPRTPRRPTHDMEDVELTLLEEDERRQAAVGVSDGEPPTASRPKPPMSAKDKRSMFLLCILCESPCCHHICLANSC